MMPSQFTEPAQAGTSPLVGSSGAAMFMPGIDALG